jgi:hypothetical protein
MRRRARAVPFAGRRPDSVVRDIALVPSAGSPKHLRLALNILLDELQLEDEEARALLLESCSAGHVCARAINRRSLDLAALSQCLTLRKIFARMARCSRRSSASLRRSLDCNVSSAIDDAPVDLETIEAVIHALPRGVREVSEGGDFFDGAPPPKAKFPPD